MSEQRRFPLFAVYTCFAVAFSVYVVLDTFVISRTYAVVNPVGTAEAQEEQATPTAGEAGAASSTDVGVTTYRYGDTTVYVADVYTDDVTNLVSAFAHDSYGHNVSDTTSRIAEEHSALLAINGDNYGSRSSGYVVRNGQVYRSEPASANQEDLVIYRDGSFEIVREGDVSAEELVEQGAWQVFSFGPGLVEDGEVSVGPDDEVDRAMASNPRTAIGKVSDGHYVLVVSDGRTSESVGLSLDELATFMAEELGVECAYNLDGGGSSTMYYGDGVVNNPTTSGRSVKERSVTDVVYVAG